MAIVSTKEGTLGLTTVREWCKNYHYAKRVPQICLAFGWTNDLTGELEAVLTIGKPASPPLCKGICGEEFKTYVYELNRICAKDTLSVPLSKFVGEVLRLLPNMILVSYADTEWKHVGYIYQATNWLYTGATKARTDVNVENHARHYDKSTIDYTQRKFRSSKHRYVIFTGDKRFRKTIRKHLNYPVMPYPKGDSQKYEITWA